MAFTTTAEDAQRSLSSYKTYKQQKNMFWEISAFRDKVKHHCLSSPIPKGGLQVELSTSSKAFSSPLARNPALILDLWTAGA